jgi:voltage-dependent calcium channel L type alpha-1D
VLHILNLVFLILYGLEAIFKMLAYGLKGYFSKWWNIFDFLLLIGGFLDHGLGHMFTALAIFRASRCIKVFHSIKLQQLFRDIVTSLSSVGWVMCLMLLFFYIYAVIGMLLFARIPFAEPDSQEAYSTSINFRNNFQNLPSALFLLFRTMTGEDWQGLMEGAYISEGQQGELCEIDHPDGSTCGSPVNSAFFISFTLIVFLLVLNVMVAVIMDNFEDALGSEPSLMQIHHLRTFVKKWRDFDPEGTGEISRSDLTKLLKSVEPPLGLGKLCPSHTARNFLGKLPVPLSDRDTVEFRPALMGLARVRLNVWLFDFPDEHTLQTIMEKIAPNSPVEHVKEAAKAGGKSMSMRVYYIVLNLQHIFRYHRLLKMAREGKLDGDAKRKLSLIAHPPTSELTPVFGERRQSVGGNEALFHAETESEETSTAEKQSTKKKEKKGDSGKTKDGTVVLNPMFNATAADGSKRPSSGFADDDVDMTDFGTAEE